MARPDEIRKFKKECFKWSDNRISLRFYDYFFSVFSGIPWLLSSLLKI